MIILACAALLVGSMVFVFQPAYGIDRPEEKTRLRSLEERRDAIYDNLRDLNFEHKAGKFTEDDFEAMRASLENEAAMVLAEIDSISRQS